MKQGDRVGKPQGYGYKMGTILKVEQGPDGQEQALVQFESGLTYYVLTAQLRVFPQPGSANDQSDEA